MKIIKLIVKARLMLLLSMIILILSAYKKDDKQNEKQKGNSYADNDRFIPIINVSNINELYAAVNDPANVNTRIVMTAGTYKLDPTQPNGGRLELQKDMELRGQPGRSDLVTIDASFLPPGSFKPSSGIPKRTGAIRIGSGFNSIEWLTVKGNADTIIALSAIDSDLNSDSTHVRLAHLIVTGSSQIGIDIRNSGAVSIGRYLEADIFDNDIFGNTAASGNGITIQNSNGATGANIVANLFGNYVHGNNTGLRSHNQHSNSARITINSTADRFDENGIGIILNVGLDINDAATITTANRNFLSFEAHATSVRKNINKLPPDSPPACGIYVAGGVTTKVADRASSNILEMKLWGCFISGNQGFFDIKAFGARSLSGAIAGTNNLVIIHLNGITKSAKVKSIASDPIEPAGTNVVNFF